MARASIADLQKLRERYRADRERLMESLQARGAFARGLRSTLRKLSDLADKLLLTLWSQAGFEVPFALVAVGGFGRGELFPRSDVDVLLLMPPGQSPETNALLKSRIEAFIGSCWDTGLEIGSSVRSLDECLHMASEDITVQTALLESRLIAGNALRAGAQLQGITRWPARPADHLVGSQGGRLRRHLG